jgi:membrane-associated phospholipid phosphatase
MGPAKLCVALTLLGGAAAAQPAPFELTPPTAKRLPMESPFKVDLFVDLPLIAAGATLWVVPYAVFTTELQPPFCDPCDRSKVNSFDRLAIGLHHSWSTWAADGQLAALAPFFFTLELIDYGGTNWRGWGSDMVVVAESVVMSGVINEWVRRSVRRPRPFMYEVGVYPDERTSAEAVFSYYSGHTAAIFAFSVSTAWAFQMRHPHSPWIYPMWVGLMLFSGGQAAFRVLSGEHFPTDVIFGAVVGSAVGVLVPALHLRRRETKGVRLSITPTVGQGSSMISIGGSF